MKRLSLAFAASVLVSSAVSSAASSQPPATDGTWHPVSAVLGGQKLPKEVRDGIVLKLSGDQYDVRVNGRPDKGTCKIDSTTTPLRMAITGTEGPNQGKTLLAIFEVTSADSMRVCYDLTGTAYPTEFKSGKDTVEYLVEYRRELPKGTEISGEVAGIPDSDIIELLTSEKKRYRVRLNGIDAPEPGQSYGKESRDALSQIVTGRSIRVVTLGEDRAGQVIGDVFVKQLTDGDSETEIPVNLKMVAGGYAWHYVRFAPDSKELADAETTARASGSGLWADPNAVSPWDWRKAEEEKQAKK